MVAVIIPLTHILALLLLAMIVIGPPALLFYMAYDVLTGGRYHYALDDEGKALAVFAEQYRSGRSTSCFWLAIFGVVGFS